MALVAAIFHKKRVGKHIAIVEGPPPAAPGHPIGRLPRITRYMALAVYYEDLIRKGHVHAYAEIATLGHFTRARVTKIMNLRLLAPAIQETLMSSERIVDGGDADFKIIGLGITKIPRQHPLTSSREILDKVSVR